VSTDKKIKITLIKSRFGLIPKRALCVKALGLKHIRHTVEREDTPSVRGLINKISDLVIVSN